MKGINVLLAIGVSLLLALLLFEGGLRLCGFGPQPTINEFHDKLGWAKRPEADVDRSTNEFDINFKINRYGLRDDEDLGKSKKPNTLRVMMLGDSFVLGYTVDRHDLFVDQLEGWWASEERRVEVINAGTEGYSTDQQALWFHHYGMEYQPDVVLIFPYLNDIYWNGEPRYNRYPKPLFREDGEPETGQLVDPGGQSFAQRVAIGRFLGGFFKPKGTDEHAFQPPGAQRKIYKEHAPLLNETPAFLADALKRTKGALTGLKKDCDAIGARLLLVPIPPEFAIHDDEKEKFQELHLAGLPDDRWSPMKPVNTFLAMADELGIETMDPRSALQVRAENGERLYFEDEWHFNPDGNRAMTHFLYNEFDNRGVFPDAHQAISRGAIPEYEPEGGIKTRYIVFACLWLALTILYCGFYRDEPVWQPPVKVAALLAVIFTIIFGGQWVLGLLPPNVSQMLLILFVLIILGFVAWKLGRRLGTIAELLKSFTLRGHWYLMPLVVVLLTIGSLLVVAASSPLVAPFIYTLF